MRHCAIILPWGRNVMNIMDDTRDYLRRQGYDLQGEPTPGKSCGVIAFCAEGDVVPSNLGWEIHPVTANGQDISGHSLAEWELPLVFVLNGGMTQQQWAVNRAFWTRALTRTWEPLSPCIALNVQPDGVHILGETGWVW